MNITHSIETFILSWVGIASNWGMNRTVAQIHALLLVSEEPMTADEIKTTLMVARSNVSLSLRELQSWGLIEMVTIMDDRKKRFEAIKDINLMFKRIMSERKKREVETALKSLNECSKAMSKDAANSKTVKQIKDLTHVFEKLEKAYNGLIHNA